MKLTAEFIKYSLYRIASTTLIVLSMHHLIFNGETQNFALAALYFALAIFFHIKYSFMKPTPKQAKCLEKTDVLVRVSISLGMMIGYGVSILILYLYILGAELLLTPLSIFGVIMLLSLASYIYVCKKEK